MAPTTIHFDDDAISRVRSRDDTATSTAHDSRNEGIVSELRACIAIESTKLTV